MRLAVTLAVCLVVLSSIVFAGRAQVIHITDSTSPNLLQDVLLPLSSEPSCPVTIKELRSDRRYTGTWPAPGGDCVELDSAPAAEVTFPFATDWSNNAKILIESAQLNPQSYQSTQLTGFLTDDESNARMRTTTIMHFLFDPVNRATIDNYTAINIPYPSNQNSFALPIFSLAFCGEELDVTFDKNTLTPSEILYAEDDDDWDCANSNMRPRVLWSNVPGATTPNIQYEIRSFWGTMQGRNNMYTLPLTQGCTEYVINVSDRSHSDWNLNLYRNMTQDPNDASTFRYYDSAGSGGSDTALVEVKTSGQYNLAQNIHVQLKDGSGGNGGISFTIYCVDPVDPDIDPQLCASAGGVWDNTVNSSRFGYACCGDDGQTEAGTISAGMQCLYNSTSSQYSWDTICHYPSSITINNRPGDQTPAGNTFLNWPGIVPNEACCSDPANLNRVHTSATDQAVCQRDIKTNLSKWYVASAENNAFNFTNKNLILASTGTRWLSCLAPQGALLAPVRPTNKQSAGSCTISGGTGGSLLTGAVSGIDNLGGFATQVPCDPATDPSCGSGGGGGGGGSGGSGGGSGSGGNAQTPSCPAQSTCTVIGGSSLCDCPLRYSWDGTQCTAYSAQQAQCPTNYKYDPSTDMCIDAGSIFPDASQCILANNSVSGNGGAGYICLDRWVRYDDDSQYTFNSSQSYVNLSDYAGAVLLQKKQSIKYVCDSQQLVAAIPRDHPDYTDLGFCSASQCYFGLNKYVTGLQESCVNQGTWALDYVCVQNGTGTEGVWSSRVQSVADALYGYAQDNALNQFIIHCDIDLDSLNNFTVNSEYTKLSTGSAPYVNNFCVLNDPKKSGVRTIAVGTTLNVQEGTQGQIEPVERYSGTVKRFVTALNYTHIYTDATTCDDALLFNDGAYHQCTNGGTGSVWYNTGDGALIWSSDPGFDFSTSWTENLLASWRNLFGTQTPDPLIDLNGQKVYVAKSGSYMVQASLVPWPGGNGGNTRATIVYQGFDASTISNITRGTSAVASTLPNGYTIIRVDNPTQTEWEQLTLVVRPK